MITGSGMPKVIHTMYGLWDDHEPGIAERFILGGWVRRNPGWTVVLWRRHHLESLLTDGYPQYMGLYRSFPRGAQKADFLRYLLVFHWGGAYADLDLYCRGPIGNSLGDREALFHTETTLTSEESLRHGRQYTIRCGTPEKRQRIANYFFAARPGHVILQKLLSLIERRAQNVPREDYDVLYITGPDAMTEAVLSSEDDGIRVLSEAEGKGMALHLCHGAWRDNRDIAGPKDGSIWARMVPVSKGRLRRLMKLLNFRPRGRLVELFKGLLEFLESSLENSVPGCLGRACVSLDCRESTRAIVQEIFSRIGYTNRFLMEIGQDQISRDLLLRDGWSGVFVGPYGPFLEMAQDFFGPSISCVESSLKAEPLELTLSGADLPQECDLLVLYLGGAEYEVWRAFQVSSPRVVCVFYNAGYLPWSDYRCEREPDSQWDGSCDFSASLKTLQRLARQKGYRLVACNRMGLCAFFVRVDLVDDKFALPGNTYFHYRCPKHRWGSFGYPSQNRNSNFRLYQRRMGRPPTLRPGTLDAYIWNEVPREYATLPVTFCDDDVVMDLGVHVGAFSAWAALRGAPRVVGFEAARQNFEIASRNLKGLEACEIHHAAVWKSEGPWPAELLLLPSPDAANTGGNQICSDGVENGEPAGAYYLPKQTAPVLALDTVLAGLPRVRFMKIDIEGSEFPVLTTSKQLNKVFEIAGEYHTGASKRVEDTGEPQSMEKLAIALVEQGFWVIWRPLQDDLGLFFASRERSLLRRLQRCWAFGPWFGELGLFEAG
jgi:FkbM family methyltransferase